MPSLNPREKTTLVKTSLARKSIRKDVLPTKPKSHALPKGRIHKKMGPRAGTRRIQSDVSGVLQSYVDNFVGDIVERIAILCQQADRHTVRASHVAAAAKTANIDFLADDF